VAAHSPDSVDLWEWVDLDRGLLPLREPILPNRLAILGLRCPTARPGRKRSCYAHLEVDPLRRASEHIGNRLAAAPVFAGISRKNENICKNMT
jgi:hypothetical protein